MALNIEEQLHHLQVLKKSVNEEFSLLSDQQINFKPTPDKWSVGECLLHIITTNETYFPVFHKIATGNYQMSLWQKYNPFSRMIGKSMIKQMGPHTYKTFKTLQIFMPATSKVGKGILVQFSEHQDNLMEYLSNFQDIKSDSIIINSPASNVITYSLSDAIRIITGHEERHINQARNVVQLAEFPTV